LFLISSSHLIIGILSLLYGIVNQILKIFQIFLLRACVCAYEIAVNNKNVKISMGIMRKNINTQGGLFVDFGKFLWYNI